MFIHHLINDNVNKSTSKKIPSILIKNLASNAGDVI